MTDRTRNPQPFRIARTVDGGWYWKIVAANGETLAHSETYTTRLAARQGITSVLANVTRALRQHPNTAEAIAGTVDDDGGPDWRLSLPLTLEDQP